MNIELLNLFIYQKKMKLNINENLIGSSERNSNTIQKRNGKIFNYRRRSQYKGRC